MSLIKNVENLARGAVGTATSAVRHPIGTTALAVGVAKGVATSGLDLLRRHDVPEQPAPPAQEPATQESAPAPEKDLPGPDIVLAGVPDPDDLPEPIVIVADDDPTPAAGTGTGEAFQTEPKATTRADTVGGRAGDLFEAEDEAGEALEDLTGPQ